MGEDIKASRSAPRKSMMYLALYFVRDRYMSLNITPVLTRVKGQYL